MSMQEIICEESFNYIVFKNNQGAYLTFLIGGPVEFDYTVKLTNEEAAAISSNFSLASEMVQGLKENKIKLQQRKLKSALWPTNT